MAFRTGSPRTRWLASAAWVTLVFTASPSRAQTSPAPSGGAEARRSSLYREAAEAAKAGHWSVARDRLREVLSIRESPKVLFSLAQAEEQLGAVGSASAHYESALQGARAAGEEEVAKVSEAAQRAVEPRVPHARVLVTGISDVRSVTATLDGRSVAVGTSAPVNPGEHVLAVSAPGMAEISTSISLREGQELDVPIRFDARGAVPPAPTDSARPPPLTPPHPLDEALPAPKPTPGPGPWATVGLVTAGAGVVAIGVGAFFGVESAAKHGDAQKACPGSTCVDPNGVTLWHDAVTDGNLSTAAFLTGGVALAGGLVTWLVARNSSAADARVVVGLDGVRLVGAW